MARLWLGGAAALLGAQNAAAWWGNGHMLVANIAYNQLSATSRAAVDPLISLLASEYPTSPDFITAACWPDDLKTMGVHQYDQLHYVDLPVVQSGFWWEIPAVGNISINPWAINSAVATLSSTGIATDLDQAIWLRFLIHFVGDIHQPLHAATLFSQQFPASDAGGNLYNITGVNASNELHGYWDSGADQWQNDLPRPLAPSGTQWLNGWVATITGAYPASAFANQLTLMDPFGWGVESNAIAGSFAYTAPQTPVPIPAAYASQAAQICQKQVALGGYRLAQIIESIYNPSSETAGVYAQIASAYLAAIRERVDGGNVRSLRGGRN